MIKWTVVSVERKSLNKIILEYFICLIYYFFKLKRSLEMKNDYQHRMDIVTVKRWIDEAVQDWHTRQTGSPSGEYYLFYRQGDVGLAILEKGTGRGWKQASEISIQSRWTVGQAKLFCFDVAVNLPLSTGKHKSIKVDSRQKKAIESLFEGIGGNESVRHYLEALLGRHEHGSRHEIHEKSVKEYGNGLVLI